MKYMIMFAGLVAVSCQAMNNDREEFVGKILRDEDLKGFSPYAYGSSFVRLVTKWDDYKLKLDVIRQELKTAQMTLRAYPDCAQTDFVDTADTDYLEKIAKMEKALAAYVKDSDIAKIEALTAVLDKYKYAAVTDNDLDFMRDIKNRYQKLQKVEEELAKMGAVWQERTGIMMLLMKQKQHKEQKKCIVM